MERVIHEERGLSFFEKYLTLWVIGCIGLGILLGKLFPQVALTLDRIAVYQVSIPIAICLFFMMYPIMVKIDFAEVIKAGKTPKPVLLTLFINWYHNYTINYKGYCLSHLNPVQGCYLL